jgi:hypothetical protein
MLTLSASGDSQKRARGPEASESNKQQRLADPASLPPLPIHILTVNIDGIDPGKWEQITNMPVFPQLDIIILTEHHLSAKFRPAYIVESGWDILMVAGPPKQGHLRHIDRGGVAILWKTSANWESKTRNSIRPRIAPIGTSSAPRGQSSPNASYTQYTLPEYIPALTGQAPRTSTTPSSNKTSFPHSTHTFTLAILMPTSRKNKKKHP